MPQRPRLILAFLSIAAFMTFLDVSIVNVALPTIEAKLAIPTTQLPYVVTTYGMLLGGFVLLCGRLADTYGRRRTLRIGLTLFALASLVAGLAQNAVMLITARGAQGLGAALIATSALSLLTSNFAEGPARTKALGVWGALSGLASVAGVTLGGVLTDGPGWRWIFFINVPIGLAGALVAPLVVDESRGAGRGASFDVPGALLLTSGLVVLIFTLGRTVDDSGVPAALVTGGFVLAALLLAGFLLVERRAAAPLIPLGVFRRPSLRAANITAVLLLGNVVTLFFFASLFMQQALGYSPMRTGLAYVPLAVVVAVGAGTASQLVTRFAARPVLLAGLALVLGGMLLLWRAPADSSYPTDILPAFLIAGLGLGTAFVPLQVVAFAGVEEGEAGLAAGLINTSQEVGGALGLAVAATFAFRDLDRLTRHAHGVPSLVREARVQVFHDAFLVGAGLVAAGLAVALAFLPRRPPVLPVAGEARATAEVG
ncbi:drug resistance transporter, EmrB/QacA subfamily [Actinacidiphila yanglinensis]|uniref:Drug resistance transporter, EmrB/QacA subfamily n=1 Tax=Actinacidiphila yanglinensis TaxID=310779 RepID=A0A1H5S971_9ACTN|nr:MFS transporter [Actinacidiphila yanglinensis]SEF47156.1 drug resistance transporter, EmrB/QacA subfamily [Actinacidiphila yanglinensis]